MSHWSGQAQQWDRVGAPLRPTPEVVQALCQPLRATGGSVLVLGVTPELTAALPLVLAVDRNPSMLAQLWPGDQPGRRALCADWLELAPPPEPLSAAVGDGSLTVLGEPQRVASLLERLTRLLPSGAPVRLRVFVRPERPWSLEQLKRLTEAPAAIPFHAFKWMLAMHLAAQANDQVPVTAILQAFRDHWPEREQLASTTGWSTGSIDTVDVYQGSSDLYWFPTASTLQLLAAKHLSDVALEPCGTYALAEQCPILRAVCP